MWGGVGPPWIKRAPEHPQMLTQIGIWGIWRPGQHLELSCPQALPEQLLWCGRVHCPAEGATVIGAPLP